MMGCKITARGKNAKNSSAQIGVKNVAVAENTDLFTIIKTKTRAS